MFERLCALRPASEKLRDPMVYGWRSLEPPLEVVGVKNPDVREDPFRTPSAPPRRRA
jgi:hypothetical protein